MLCTNIFLSCKLKVYLFSRRWQFYRRSQFKGGRAEKREWRSNTGVTCLCLRDTGSNNHPGSGTRDFPRSLNIIIITHHHYDQATALLKAVKVAEDKIGSEALNKFPLQSH